MPFKSAAMLSSMAPPFFVSTFGMSVTCLVARFSSSMISTWSCMLLSACCIGGKPWPPETRWMLATWHMAEAGMSL